MDEMQTPLTYNLPTASDNADAALQRQRFIRIRYEPHSDPELEMRVRAGQVVIGRLAVYKRWTTGLCFVRSRCLPRDVVLNQHELRGKAMHGDVVAVELLPQSEWQAEQQVLADTEDEDDLDGPLLRKRTADERTSRGRPRVLPDGRPILHCLRAENMSEALDRLPIEVQLTQRLFGLPSGVNAATYDWPPDRVPCGRVVRILWRELNAFQPAHLTENVLAPGQAVQRDFFYRFKPYDPLLPQLVVRGADIPQHFHDDVGSYLFLLHLQADAQGELQGYGRDMIKCTVQSSMGKADSVTVNNIALCAIHDIPPDSFADDVEACVPATLEIPSSAEVLERVGRRDLRASEFVCTIDPATARDLDDALSIRRNHHTGGYHVGVHIADVSYFVRPGTPLDAEARHRATSTYLIDKAIPMLPRKLSEDYCSLNPFEDKFAFSALFELDKEGEVVSEWFGQSVIRSRCRLTYEQAQRILDAGTMKDADKGEDEDEDVPALDVSREAVLSGMSEPEVLEKVHASVRLLYEVAAKRRRRSLERGRLTVANFRLTFTFDDKDSRLAPTGFYVKRQIDANWLVEEFMLLANARVAEKVVQYLPDEALLREHQPPRRQNMNRLRLTLGDHGVHLVGSSAKALQETLDNNKNHPLYRTLCQSLIYNLQRAIYVVNGCSGDTPGGHFALGLPWYTHFTSPIRRYSDIIVHRQLLVALEVEQMLIDRGVALPSRPDPMIEAKPGSEQFRVAAIDATTLRTRDCFMGASELEAIAMHLNKCKENARQAGEMSVELFFCLYLRALAIKASVNPQIPLIPYTKAVLVRLSTNSMQLYADEIALSNELSLTDKRHRFRLVRTNAATPGESGHDAPQDRPEINRKAKSHRREKGGKAGMPHHPSPACKGKKDNEDASDRAVKKPDTSVTLEWPCASGEPVIETLELYSDLVVALTVTTSQGRMTLNMQPLPPWERAKLPNAGHAIPTSLV